MGAERWRVVNTGDYGEMNKIYQSLQAKLRKSGNARDLGGESGFFDMVLDFETIILGRLLSDKIKDGNGDSLGYEVEELGQLLVNKAKEVETYAPKAAAGLLAQAGKAYTAAGNEALTVGKVNSVSYMIFKRERESALAQMEKLPEDFKGLEDFKGIKVFHYGRQVDKPFFFKEVEADFRNAERFLKLAVTAVKKTEVAFKGVLAPVSTAAQEAYEAYTKTLKAGEADDEKIQEDLFKLLKRWGEALDKAVKSFEKKVEEANALDEASEKLTV